MIFNIFRKKDDNRDLNQLIFDIAEYKKINDYKRCCKLLLETELFTRVEKSNIEFKDREKVIAESQTKVELPTAEFDGYKMVLFYTDFNDSRIEGKKIGMKGREIFQMILKTKLDGLVVQNSANSWIVIKSSDMNQLLK